MTNVNGSIAQAEAEALGDGTSHQQEQNSLTPSDTRPSAPPPIPDAPAVPLTPAPFTVVWFEQVIANQQAAVQELEARQQRAYAEWQQSIGVLNTLTAQLALARQQAK